MSNHSGSYLLNSVLELLDDFNVYEYLGKEKTLAFMQEIRKLSRKHDCNAGEILEDIGEKLRICYGCWSYGDNFENEVCEQCRKEFVK